MIQASDCIIFCFKKIIWKIKTQAVYSKSKYKQDLWFWMISIGSIWSCWGICLKWEEWYIITPNNHYCPFQIKKKNNTFFFFTFNKQFIHVGVFLDTFKLYNLDVYHLLLTVSLKQFLRGSFKFEILIGFI